MGAPGSTRRAPFPSLRSRFLSRSHHRRPGVKRVGMGGFQMFDGNLGTPIFVERRLVWMTPERKDAFPPRRGERKASIRIEDLLTMRSGTDYHEGGPTSPHAWLNRRLWGGPGSRTGRATRTREGCT